MKVLLLLCMLGLAAADDDVKYVFPYAQGAMPYYPMPYVYPGVKPITYAYPYVKTVGVIQPGYVAKTPGAKHYAPLPQGLAYASHHINVAPAPGTE